MLPWHTKSILVIIENPPKMRCPASICRVLATSTPSIQTGNNVAETSKRGKMRQAAAVNRSKNVVEIGGSYYHGILAQTHALWYREREKSAPRRKAERTVSFSPAAGYRCILAGKYLICCRQFGDTVVIYHIAHVSTDYPKLLKTMYF